MIAVTGPSRRGTAPRRLVQLGIWLAGGRSTWLSPARPRPSGAYRAVVITGGHDVDPVLYAARGEVTPRHDRERDAFESRIIDDALARGLPMLGICRGAQLINVRLGGSLLQDLRARRRLTSRRWSILPLRTLRVNSGTQLEQMLGTARTRINMLHNQAIDRLGDGLQVSAYDLDGIVQAVESPRHPYLVGVQWHPELLLYMRRQRALFRALVRAAAEAGPAA